jgi:hypothetical protein
MMKFENIQFQLVDAPAFTDEGKETGLFYMVRNGDILLLVVDLGDEPILQLEMIFDEIAKKGIGLIGKEGEKVDNSEKKVLIVGNKVDLEGSALAYEEVKKKYGQRHSAVAISAKAKINLEEFKKEAYKASDIIRVYTKMPGKEPDLGAPFILKNGGTVLDLAERIHKDFTKRLKYARIWGSEKHNGQKVKRDHILQDGDILEIHI